jgi:hypothetical protein
MITYVRVEKGEGERPVAVRPKAGMQRSEYCFGLHVWRGSIKGPGRTLKRVSRPTHPQEDTRLFSSGSPPARARIVLTSG